ncbi:MAG: PorT family protein [Paludibacteraceae bacterium]|nr:PorT family protein [Paludibacteraceae bacterium]MBN2788122.1 PorT family protein [Paludibacteraceae bacterium]
MKKLMLLFTGLSMMVSLSAGTALGLKGGLQSTRIYDNIPVPSNSYYRTLRSNVGLVCNFGYTSPVSFQMEVNYARKGSKLSNGDRRTFGYLELPLLLKISGGKEKFKVFGVAGPYIAAPLRDEWIVGDKKTVTSVMDDNTVIEKMDLGFHVGGGVTYKLGPGRLLGEIRYCQGFGESFVENSFNTNAWQLNIGYLFTFGDED